MGTELSQLEINRMINESIKMMDESFKDYPGSKYKTLQGRREIRINGKVVYKSFG